MNAGRTLALARKEWIQLRRDSRSMILAFLLPILLLVFFGYAISLDVDEIPLGVHDQDRSQASRALVEAFEASGYFVVAERFERYGEIDRSLVRGSVAGALVIPPGFQRDLDAGRPAPTQLLLDGADANTATIALNYADAISASFSTRWLGVSERAPRVLPESRVWYNPTLRSADMIVPALIAVIMSIIAAMLTALTIAREWERGTMEQLIATPVGRFEVVFGKLIPYLVIGVVDVTVTIVAGILFFDVPLRGDLGILSLYTLLFLTGALGLGVFISAAVKSQVLASQVAMLATYLPALLLSGFLFDIASMPLPLQGITYLIPARYFVTVTRAVFLKDAGMSVLWAQGLAMGLFAAVGLLLAVRAFRKELPA